MALPDSDSKEDTIPDQAEIQEWLKEEAVKREREVQEAQKRVEAARVALEERRAASVARDNLEQTTTRLEGLLETRGASPNTQDAIREVCDTLRDFLIEKNEQYGDSATRPVRIFSKADPAEQLLVRLDDKLSRIARGDDRLESDDDVLDDLIGYLILYKVAKLHA